MLSGKKVLHIVTSVEGGAGIAARRLHSSLLDQGVDSEMLILSGRNSGRIHSHLPTFIIKLLNFIQRFLLKVGFGKVNGINRFVKKIGNYEIITSSRTIYRAHRNNAFLNADIIHLHWISNFIDYSSFFKVLKKTKKNIVWTLHDMNPFMGIFHYEQDKMRNKQLEELDSHHLEIKEKCYLELGDQLHINFLNEWMKNKSLQYNLLNNFDSKVIPNCIDLNSFKAFDKEKIRVELGIPLNKYVLLIASQDLNNYRKGVDLLVEAINKIKYKKDYLILSFGANRDLKFSGVSYKPFGPISDTEMMSKLYSCSDLFVIPSREDNLPNVMLEAWACGLPVLSFDNGGMKDHINSFNGLLARSEDTDDLAEKIQLAKEIEFNSQEIQLYCKNNFSPEVVSKQIINFYNECFRSS